MKFYKNWIFWAVVAVMFSVGGAYAYNQFSGGQAGVEHKAANGGFRGQKTVKDIKNLQYPTIEDVREYLIDKTGQKDLSEVGQKELRSDMTEKWNKDIADAAFDGRLLSTNMSVGQGYEAEVALAKYDKQNKDYVGFTKNNYQTSLYDGSMTKNQNTVDSYLPGGNYNDGEQIWSKVDKYKVSQPNFIFMNSDDNDHVTCVLFVQVPNEGKTTREDLQKFAKDKLTMKVNDKDAPLAKDSGLSKIKMTKSDFSKSNEIFPASIVPVAYDVPVSDFDNDSKTARVYVPATTGRYDIDQSDDVVLKF